MGKNDNEKMNFFINEYDKYLIREKERIEEENKKETKQPREIENFEAELKYTEKITACSNYLFSHSL